MRDERNRAVGTPTSPRTDAAPLLPAICRRATRRHATGRRADAALRKADQGAATPHHATPRFSTSDGRTPPPARRICSARATRSQRRPRAVSIRASWPSHSCSRSSCHHHTHHHSAARAPALLTMRPRLRSGATRRCAACRARIGRRCSTAASRASCASAGCAPHAAQLRPPPHPPPLTAPPPRPPRPPRPARRRCLPGRPASSRARRRRRRRRPRACR